MKNFYIYIFILFFKTVSAQQENGNVSFDLPANNSLKFNKFVINPAFSFVREDKSIITLLNKRQWTSFENPPQLFFISYSGKIGDNNGIGFGIFQQNFGVLSTTGIVTNYARNIVVNDDSNLTFGFNFAAFRSGLDAGKVLSNLPDPVLNNFPTNTLLSISPGLNYESGFFDFGIYTKNIIVYNLKTSNILRDDPAKSIDGHIMYTGFLEASGILEDSKFSALARGEMRKDNTILATTFMLNAPKIGWLQAGYNSLLGVSAGAGANVAQNFSLGLTYEKAIGGLVDRGSALEFMLSYHFEKADDQGYSAPVSTLTYAPKEAAPTLAQADLALSLAAIEKEKQKELAQKLIKAKEIADAKAFADAEKAKISQTAKQKADEAAKIKAQEIADAKKLADEQAKVKAKEIADAKAIADAEKAKISQTAKQKADEAAKIKAQEIAEAKKLADDQAKAKAQEIADAKAIADAEKAKLAQEARQKSDEAAKIKAQEIAEANKLADEQAKAKAKEIADAKAIADAEKAKLAQEIKQKADEAAKIKAKEIAEAKKLADQQAKAKAKEIADAKAIADAEKAKLAQEAKQRSDEAAKIKAKEIAEAKKLADEQAKAKAQEIAEAKKLADEQAKTKAKEIADAKAIADAEKAKLAQEAKQRSDEVAKIKAQEIAEAKKLADEQAKVKAQEIADAKAIADAQKSKLAQEVKQKADEAAKIKAQEIAEAKKLADEQAKAKAQEVAEAKKLADDQAKIKAKELADAKAISDAEKAKISQTAKQKADEAAKIKAQEIAEAKKLADEQAKAKAQEIAEAKKLADEQAKAKAKEIADAKAIADAEKAKLAQEAKQKSDEAAKIKAQEIAEAKKLADEQAKAKALEIAEAKKLADEQAKAKAKEIADAKAIADAEKAKLAQEAKQRSDEAAKIKAQEIAEAKKLADEQAKAKAREIADAKATADAEKAKLAQEIKQKADEAAKAKAKEITDARDALQAQKAKLAQEAKQKAEEIAKAKANADTQKLQKDIEDAKVATLKDDNDRSMDYLKQVTEENTKALAQNLKRLDSLAKSRQTDLNDLKEENDTGVIKPEKPFQSASIARKALANLKSEIEEGTKSQTEFISQFENLLKERLKKIPNKNDAINIGYQKAIDNLKSEIIKLESLTVSIDAKLEKINAEIEVEKKRKIKKANFENSQGRYEKDRASLLLIKQSTPKSISSTKPEDFDFGDDENNMQILKKIENTTTGFYIILAVHKDAAKRDAFVTKVVASGEQNVDYFYNVTTGKYFIYIKSTESLTEAQKLLDQKDNKGYNNKKFIVKIQN